jgi:hypothetical protein
MKRYILLVGSVYYPAGWDDYQGSFDSTEEARQAVGKLRAEWFEIIDTITEKVVDRSQKED